MKILFICDQNLNRSKTAELLFKNKFETKSAGLYNEKPVTRQQIEWTDTIIVMEKRHKTELAKRFPKLYMKKQIISLDIPDIYYFNQPELINELKSKVNKLF